MIGQIEQQFEPLIVALKVCMSALGLFEIQRPLDRQSHVICNERKEADFLFRIGIGKRRAELDDSKSPMRRG